MKKLFLIIWFSLFASIAIAQTGDISNPQTNASALSVGTLPAGRMPALTSDCTTSAGSVATNCLKTNGVAFAPSATTDTTNAANIGSGILPAARLPSGALTNSLAGNVALSATGSFFSGPVVAQGGVGTWVASGTMTMVDTASATFNCKLWDGTSTPMSSGSTRSAGASLPITMSLSGMMVSPAGNLRIDCQDTTSVNGNMLSNSSGVNKDSTITVYRVN